MVPLFTIVSFLLLFMETLIGMVANGSIVLIHFIDWLRSRKLSPADLILICLSLSRFLLQAVVIFTLSLFVLLNNTIRNNNLPTLQGIWLFTDAVNFWFAACLSVFYLAKIAIFSHPVFLQVKRRVSRLVPWMLLGSVVYSAVVSVTVTTSWSCGFLAFNPYKPFLSNRSSAEMGVPPPCGDMTTMTWVIALVPLMVFLSSSILLITSLWKHMRRVKQNRTGNRDLSTQAHLSAIQALTSFAVLYLVSFAVVTSQSVLVWKNQRNWAIMLYPVSALYPSGHAIILILINPKLKQAWVRMIRNLKCLLSKGPS